MQLLTDVIDTILNGTESEKQEMRMSYFKLANTPEFLQNIGITGQEFTIRYGVITHHKKKDSDHDFTADEWEQICEKISEPFAVEGYENGFNLFLDIKHNDTYVLVGVEVKSAGKDHFVNAVKTIFAKKVTSARNIIYTSKKITPEQQALLNGTNLRQYPANGR